MNSLLINLLVLSGALGAAWYWFDSRRTHERAVRICRTLCQRAEVLLLDETVAESRVTIARDDKGRLRLRRRFNFEYSDDVTDRRRGYIVMLGAQVEGVFFEDQYTLA